MKGSVKMKGINLAIVGATGLVGQTFLKVLEKRNFPINQLYCFASSRSAGKVIEFKGKEYVVEELTKQSFDKEIDLALFSAGGAISKKFAPIAAQKGIRVVDNSSAWRMDPEIPLIVPEVNANDLNENHYIIANPNCSTIQSVVPLKVLHEAFKIKRIIYSTYQAVSGSGVKGLKDLEEGTSDFYPHQISGNCLPHIDIFLENGYTKEEIKMIEETKKILGDQGIQVTATTVRVPVKYGHCVSMNLQFERDFTLDQVYTLLQSVDGLVLHGKENPLDYPTPLDVEGQDEVHVGRIRRDFSVEHGLSLWVVADNIRKGAATNTVQIAERLLTYL